MHNKNNSMYNYNEAIIITLVSDSFLNLKENVYDVSLHDI